MPVKANGERRELAAAHSLTPRMHANHNAAYSQGAQD